MQLAGAALQRDIVLQSLRGQKQDAPTLIIRGGMQRDTVSLRPREPLIGDYALLTALHPGLRIMALPAAYTQNVVGEVDANGDNVHGPPFSTFDDGEKPSSAHFFQPAAPRARAAPFIFCANFTETATMSGAQDKVPSPDSGLSAASQSLKLRIHMMRSAESQIEEARALLQAARHTADRRRYNKLLEWTRSILIPLAEQKIGEAMWLLRSIPEPKSKDIPEEEFERQYRRAAEEAAGNGSASAMFFLGCELDSMPTQNESSRYFEQAAALGHTYSKWCFGLNLLSGQGTEKDELRGIALIREAAEEKFEGAILFLSHAYAQGTYGFAKNEDLAAAWWSKLKDKGLIHY